MAGQSTPGSHRVLREAASDLRKVIAYQLGRREGIIDKWMLAPPSDAATRDANGIPNPLDHVIAIHQIVATDSPERADKMLNWLCRQCGGRFVRPEPGQRDLFANIDSAVSLLGQLDQERKRKNPRRERIAAIRRGLQSFVDQLADATATEDDE